jgi:hypothetical protein
MMESAFGNKKGPQTSRALMPYASIPHFAVVDCLRDMEGMAIGVPVSNPLRACDRYQAACVSS